MVPCVLGGQNPPGRVGGDISFVYGQLMGSGAGPSKFPYVLGTHRIPGIMGEGLVKVPKRPTHEPSVKSAGVSGKGALCEELVRLGCALGKGSREKGQGHLPCGLRSRATKGKRSPGPQGLETAVNSD